MGTRTLRTDAEDEARLERIQKSTGWTISFVLKEGVRALEQKLAQEPTNAAYEVYARLDLGPGGYASGSASNSRAAARAAILRKRRST